MAQFNSKHKVRDWLADKSIDWAQVIAVRAAMRALPFLNFGTDDWLKKHGLSIIRALAVSWANVNYSAYDMNFANQAAARAAAHGGDEGPDRSAYAAAAYAADAAAFSFVVDYAADAAAAAAEAFATDVIGRAALWKSISNDYKWLMKRSDISSAAQLLSRYRLWPYKSPDGWLERWQHLSDRLLEINPCYLIWTDWFDRRITGNAAAFDIPGDVDRAEDKKILMLLAEATDEDFWGKGHEYVNATLKGWLDEARARVAPVGLDEPETTTPPQDARATAYGVNREGKIDRLPPSDQVHLRDEPNQRRAYSDLREAIAELMEEGQRLGPRLQKLLDSLSVSLPGNFDDAEAYLVWRDFNKLRRLYRAHKQAIQSPEPDDAKLEPIIAEAVGGLADMYNVFAFTDDGLRAKDEAKVAPQERADADAEAAAAAPVVDAILANPEIAVPQALDDLAAEKDAETLPANDPYAAQTLVQGNLTKRNFVASALAWMGKTLASPKQVGKAAAIGSVGGAAGIVGKVAMTAIIGAEYAPLLDFIAVNAVILAEYVGIAFSTYPDLPGLIERIKIAWQSLQ